MTPPIFQIERLDPAKHRRDLFACESDLLTKYLRERARKEADSSATACFVIVPRDDQSRIAGYYTLAAASVELPKVPPHMTKGQPRYSHLPVTLLGRLARDLSFKGVGIGEILMGSIFARVCSGSKEIGSIGLVTDPKDATARRFYESYGFEPIDELRLILPMREVCARAAF